MHLVGRQGISGLANILGNEGEALPYGGLVPVKRLRGASSMVRVTALSSPLLLRFSSGIQRALDKVSKTAADGYPPYNIRQNPHVGRRTGEVADHPRSGGLLTGEDRGHG